MKINRKPYRNENWFAFSERVKTRDKYQCLKCGRTERESILQVHHKIYKLGLQAWEYALSDCITLCKGCHAEKHKKVEPQKGWTLISVDDLGGLDGTCEKIGCGNEIRYEHEIYHPDWGYKTVGSTCVEYLTQEDKWLSQEIIKIYKNISKFVHGSIWEIGFTKSDKEFIGTRYKHHQIRIYGNDKNYSFQIAVKETGEKWFDWKKPIFTKNKTLIEVKEMAYIVLKGTIANRESEKNILRNIYKQMQ
ncbi:MAG: HNH endonuclease [Lewinellaceae bacterium]|nr:HNH endonuclease [Lewinellaceae bacterium]